MFDRERFRRGLLATLCAGVLAFGGSAPVLHADGDDDRRGGGEFRHVATYFVSGEVAEIVAATPNGRTLLYTDSGTEVVGFVNISNPRQPAELGVVAVDGEPTSVAVTPDGRWGLASVHKSGADKLYVIAIATRSVERMIPLGGQPDSVAMSPDGRYAAIAIENERDEDVNDGIMPQGPAGFMTIVDLVGPPAAWTTRDVSLTGLAARFPEDPEPEFIDINRANQAAITLQENNHVVIVDLPTGSVVRHWPAGTTTHRADLVEDDDIKLTDMLTNARREPDAIAWTPDGRLVTANEGDYDLDLAEGEFVGGRGFTIFNRTGEVVFDPGASAELIAVRHGHYPDGRSENKGVEFEGVEVGRYRSGDYLFVGSERGNFVLVYDLRDEHRPRFKQLLPTGVGPEGLLAIPDRNLFVTSNEEDGSISIFSLSGNADYPDVVSNGTPWSGLSGMVAGPGNRLYAVPDNVFSPSRIFTMRKASDEIEVISALTLTKDGAPVTYDLEGIELRDGGFWMSVEGRGNAGAATATKNRLLKVNADGSVVQEIELPAAVNANQRSNGFEGVATNDDGSQVYVAFQREWADDAAGFVKIGRYTVATGEWAFFHYPLDAAPAGAWVGLSEITRINDTTFAIVERDNQAGAGATVKRVYEVSVAGLTPATVQPYPALTKTLRHDILADEGYRVEKWEAAAYLRNGEFLVINDNDGAGETRVVEFRYR